MGGLKKAIMMSFILNLLSYTCGEFNEMSLVSSWLGRSTAQERDLGWRYRRLALIVHISKQKETSSSSKHIHFTT